MAVVAGAATLVEATAVAADTVDTEDIEPTDAWQANFLGDLLLT